MTLLGNKNWLSRWEQSEVKKGMDAFSKKTRKSQTVSHTTPVLSPESVKEEPVFPSSPDNHVREKVLGLVAKYRKEVNEEDLPRIMKQMKAHFDAASKGQPDGLVIDLTQEPQARVVMVGDTHCDYNSLAALLEKLAISSYNYFECGYLVFDGDYLDRGSIFFEFFLLLLDLKKLLGNRCIILRGNHDTVVYNEFSRVLEAEVVPHETTDFINEYCWKDTEYLQKLANYLADLPYYVLVRNKAGVDMIVHGGIPHNNYLDKVHISLDKGELILGEGVRKEDVLHDFMWSDPCPKEDVRFQLLHSRFEFGLKQFEQFTEENGIHRIFRSHEPVENGVKSFYGNRLFTVFSNGGLSNPHTGYKEVLNPVFAIIDVEGEVRFESIHLKQVVYKDGFQLHISGLYMGSLPPKEVLELEDYHLNEEFFIVNLIRY